MAENKKLSVKVEAVKQSIDTDRTSKSPILSSNKNGRQVNRPARLNIEQLSNVRVIQKELVYVIGLPPKIADEEVNSMQILARPQYFGQYGRILKCMINKSKAFTNSSVGVSYGAYLTFSSEEEATLCIKACNGFVLEGRTLQATFGTTKYCNNFLQGLECSKSDCFFLHRNGSNADTLSKVDVSYIQHKRHIQAVDSQFDRIKVQIIPPDGKVRFLPGAVSNRERAFSEYSSPSIKVIQRHYSFDQTNSRIHRFGFAFDTISSEEEPITLPNLYEDFMVNSPLQDISEVPEKKLQELLSPSSPYKWMPDVVKIPLQSYPRTAPQSPSISISSFNNEEVTSRAY